MRSCLVAVVFACLCVIGASYRSYQDYALFSVKGLTNDMKFYQHIVDNFDIWGVDEEGHHVFAKKDEFIQFMNSNEQSYFLLQENIQKLLDEEKERLASKKDAEWFEEYHDYNSTLNWYQGLAQQYSSITTYIPSIGKTHLNRDLAAFRITASSSNAPKIWIQCNIHAREWITNAACQFVVNQILTRYQVDPDVTSLLQNVEFIIIPIVNPDGYDFTWTSDRLWRKNRRNNGGSYGVDLNRNYDEQWGGVGSSPTPSSDTYRGPSANSEPEVQALVNYFKQFNNILGAIDVHSYSQLVLRPFTHVNTPSDDEAQIQTVSDEIVSIIASVHGKKYTPGRWYSALYPSSGVSQDYYYVNGNSYGLTIELRPTTAVPGFVLPPEEIIPTGEEITPAILHFAKHCFENPLSKK